MNPFHRSFPRTITARRGLARRPVALLVGMLSCACARAPQARMNAPSGSTEASSPPVGDMDFVGRARAPGDKVDQAGLASWYADGLDRKKTASGEIYDPRAFTAAHRRLPFGTWVEVRRVDTGRSVRVRINDRGPRDARHIIDLSREAARALDMVDIGQSRVELRVVRGP